MAWVIHKDDIARLAHQRLVNFRPQETSATRLSRQQHAVIIQAMLCAGMEILRLKEAGALNPRKKPDGSWITDADLRSHEILTEKLSGIVAPTPIISEEDETHDAQGSCPNAFFLDPTDCTGDLTRGGKGFSILLGGVFDNMPAHGFALFPDPRVSAFYFTGVYGIGTYKQKIKMDGDRLVLTGTPLRLQMPPMIKGRNPRVAEVYAKGSDVLGIRPYSTPSYRAPASMIALIEGEVDLVVGSDKMCDWDSAAFDALLRKAGALTVDADSRKPLRYGETRSPERAFKQPRYIAGHPQTLKALV